MNLNEKINILKRKLNMDKSFDIIGREILIGGRMAYFIFIDGYAKDDVLYYILEALQGVEDFSSLQDLQLKNIAYIESEIVKEDNLDKLSLSVLSGVFALIVDGLEGYILIDTRTYPVRSIEESAVEKVLRGAKDSFVETIVFNTALIRRRIRSEKLIFQMKQVGKYSKTDVAISYMDGLVDEKILINVLKKIEGINTNALILSAEYIEDLLFKKRWYNPLPLVKYTERPDVAASYISEGNIVLIVDTCPVAIVLPVSIFYFAQHIGDYNMKFINGTISKILRFLSIICATFFAPIIIYLGENTNIFVELSKMEDSPEKVLLSLFMQIVVLEIAFLILQMSSLHIPSQIASIIGIVGGLLLSDMAIKSGIITPLSIMTMAITVITTYSIPSIEFSDALRIFRFFIILMTGFFGLVGLVLSILIVFIITYTTETIEGAKRYTYPLIPFNYHDLKNLLVRENIKDMK